MCFLFFGIARSAEELPGRLSDQAFWKLVTDFSETGGTFVSDNFVSNERYFQHVLTRLTKDRKPGSAYLGVGPDQNFTYIVALKPKIAFIFDIRRQNMLEHLMYKALFELSPNRQEFVSRLFSRPLPENLNKESTVTELFEAFAGLPPDPTAFQENLNAVKRRLVEDHGFTLTAEDEASLGYVYRAFYNGGASLAYSRTTIPGVMPTYEELMMQTDDKGMHRSYLASEENFKTMREYQLNNLVVPVVGDFAGPKAIRSAAEYLKERGVTVSAFYTSNVEQYLFQSEENWRRFYANVSALPVDSSSVFIRALVRTADGDFSHQPVIRPGFSRLENGLFSIGELLGSFESDMIHSYYDILQPLPEPEPAEREPAKIIDQAGWREQSRRGFRFAR